MNQNADRRCAVTVAMLGARMHYAVPRLLHEAGLLERFFTDSYIGNKPLLRAGLRVLPAWKWARRWLGREETTIQPARVSSFEWLGLRYAVGLRRSRSYAESETITVATAKRFNAAILRQAGRMQGIVWGFNGGALNFWSPPRRRAQPVCWSRPSCRAGSKRPCSQPKTRNGRAGCLAS